MADPEFPRGGGRQPSSWGGAAAKFSPKLHEIEKNFDPEEGVHPKFYYVDPPLVKSDAITNLTRF